jgi:hypothetical protein
VPYFPARSQYHKALPCSFALERNTATAIIEITPIRSLSGLGKSMALVLSFETFLQFESAAMHCTEEKNRRSRGAAPPIPRSGHRYHGRDEASKRLKNEFEAIHKASLEKNCAIRFEAQPTTYSHLTC